LTGRDLIMFILQNKLEDIDIPIPDILMSEEDVAVRFEVGLPTVRVWREIGMLKGIQIGEKIYYLKNTTDPRRNGGVYLDKNGG